LVLLVPPFWMYRRLGGGLAPISRREALAFVAVVLAVTLPWYVAVCLRAPSFADYFFWKHNVLRFLAPFDHLRPVWFYAPILLAGLLPGTLLALPFLRFLLSAEPDAARRRCPEMGFMLLAGGWCVLFFSLSGSKLPTYILPAFPPLALALGYYLSGSRWARSAVPAVVAGFAFVAIGLGHHVALPWYAAHRSPMSRAEQVRRQCADPATPVVCYPRPCDSLAFYLQRDDLLNFRSKETQALLNYLEERPRTVVVFTHRHSLGTLRQVLPPHLRLRDETPLFGSARLGPDGECYMAVVEQR
jgi:hypothetical protein